jgi:thioesterase domain-containing protein/acyl carrier protein
MDSQSMNSLLAKQRLERAESEVLNLVRRVVGADGVELDTDFIDVGIDSIATIELAAQLEACAGSAAVSASTFSEHRTARAVASHLLAITGFEHISNSNCCPKTYARTTEPDASFARPEHLIGVRWVPTAAGGLAMVDLSMLSTLREAGSHQIEVSSPVLVTRRLAQKGVATQGPPKLLLLVHTILGSVPLYDGLAHRVLRDHDILALQHEPLEGMQSCSALTFQLLASKYADLIIAAAVDTPWHMLSVSNGTALVHQVGHTLLDRGGRPGVLVLVDPDPPPRPELPLQLMTVQAAAALLLSIYEAPADAMPEEEDLGAVIAQVTHILCQHRGTAAALSTARVAQELRSIQQLARAEQAFYYDNTEPIRPYAGRSKDAGLCLVLSSEEAAVLDGGSATDHQGRPSVRHLFGGPAVPEMILEGTHLDMCLQIGRGGHSVFNELLEVLVRTALTAMASREDGRYNEDGDTMSMKDTKDGRYNE